MLAARRVSVRAGGATLLDGVSLAVRPGEILCVIGPNGAGKSTLLKVLCGDLGAAAGEVRMNGRPLRDWSLRERAKTRAVLPQETALGFPLPVFEVVLMGRSPHLRGVESAHDRDIAREALRLVEADHLARRAYTTLSGGERQRVQLARVLAQIWEAGDARSTRYLLLGRTHRRAGSGAPARGPEPRDALCPRAGGRRPRHPARSQPGRPLRRPHRGVETGPIVDRGAAGDGPGGGGR
jgi:iron complex transport system ATP-binding protein